MFVMDKLVLVVCFSAIATSRTTRRSPSEDAQPQFPNYSVQADDSYLPSAEQKLPSEEAPKVPFYISEPSTELRPPQYQSYPTGFLDVPVPSTELRVPTELSWNPENSPIYYYELPPSLTKLDTPTNNFPKKFNKVIHSKEKAHSSKPKIEIELVPIEEKELINKANSLEKKYQRLEKLRNQKELEKAFSNNEPTVAESGYASKIDDEEDHHTETDFSQGLNADLVSDMGIPHLDTTKDRLTFHIVGHDGPHTYKWGFDTGKGHDRQFRFEEKDKEGIVKGHYGYYDKHGKLHVVNYDAHPHEGFHVKRNTDNENN